MIPTDLTKENEELKKELAVLRVEVERQKYLLANGSPEEKVEYLGHKSCKQLLDEVARRNQSELSRLRQERDAYRGALEEITKGMGRYSMDRLTHANNTIEDMKLLAKKALAAHLI